MRDEKNRKRHERNQKRLNFIEAYIQSVLRASLKKTLDEALTEVFSGFKI